MEANRYRCAPQHFGHTLLLLEILEDDGFTTVEDVFVVCPGKCRDCMLNYANTSR